MKRILIIEDDTRLAELIGEYLEQQGYEILVEENGAKAGQRITDENPDLVILDLMLPGKDGLSVCREARAGYKGPILILTAREDDMDQVAGLEMGADDYVKKPVEPRVLLARIRALFRRMNAVGEPEVAENESTRLVFGKLEIDRQARNVTLGGEPVKLSTTEFDLLWLFATHSGDILDRDLISSHLKGIEYDGFDRSIDIAVSRLRKKLGDDSENPFRIKTVWGSGYLFVGDAWK